MRCCVAEDYVAMCTACKKAVDRKDLQYVNGLSYHTACSAQSGSNSGIINSDETRLKVDIVTLKNLRSLLSPRSSAGTGKKKKEPRKRLAQRERRLQRERLFTYWRSLHQLLFYMRCTLQHNLQPHNNA